MFARLSETRMNEPPRPGLGVVVDRTPAVRCLTIGPTGVRASRIGRDQQLPSARRAPLQDEGSVLRVGRPGKLITGVIVGSSPAIRRVLEQARQVAATDSTVLLLGETGTGKELIATPHSRTERAAPAGRWCSVNCAAIPGTLMESELFGREKGAFTGALARQIGRFELADHSTIFLDEIGDLPADVQVKLLRVLEDRQIERLGSPKAIRVDVRIVAATHRNLEQRIHRGTFREDLYYRLNVFPIRRAAAAGSPRRHSPPRLALRRRILEVVRQADRHHRQREHGRAAAVRLAGQHPRAPQRRGARDDRGDRSPADHRPADHGGMRRPVGRRKTVQ